MAVGKSLSAWLAPCPLRIGRPGRSWLGPSTLLLQDREPQAPAQGTVLVSSRSHEGGVVCASVRGRGPASMREQAADHDPGWRRPGCQPPGCSAPSHSPAPPLACAVTWAVPGTQSVRNLAPEYRLLSKRHLQQPLPPPSPWQPAPVMLTGADTLPTCPQPLPLPAPSRERHGPARPAEGSSGPAAQLGGVGWTSWKGGPVVQGLTSSPKTGGRWSGKAVGRGQPLAGASTEQSTFMPGVALSPSGAFCLWPAEGV